MSQTLILTLIIVSMFLISITTFFLIKGRIPEKYSLVWYFFSLLILLIATLPNIFIEISKTLGFEVMSNLVIAMIIGILLLLNMILTVMIAGQKKKTTLLIQEVSLLKKQVEDVTK